MEFESVSGQDIRAAARREFRIPTVRRQTFAGEIPTVLATLMAVPTFWENLFDPANLPLIALGVHYRSFATLQRDLASSLPQNGWVSRRSSTDSLWHSL